MLTCGAVSWSSASVHSPLPTASTLSRSRCAAPFARLGLTRLRYDVATVAAAACIVVDDVPTALAQVAVLVVVLIMMAVLYAAEVLTLVAGGADCRRGCAGCGRP